MNAIVVGKTTIILEKIVFAEISPTLAKLYLSGQNTYLPIHYHGMDPNPVEALAKQLRMAHFLDLGNLLINPARLLMVEDLTDRLKVSVDGYDNYITVRGEGVQKLRAFLARRKPKESG